MTASPLVEQLAELRKQIAELRAARVGYIEGEVTAVDTGGSTFAVRVAGQQDETDLSLSGVAAPAHFLPTIGDSVLLALSGAQPIYQPGRIGTGAVGYDELAPTVGEDITVALDAANGKNKVTFSLDEPDTDGVTAGDIWWQRDGDGLIVGTWQWDGAAWQPTTFGDEVFDTISAAKIATGALAAGVVITVGDPNGTHVRLAAAEGVTAYADDPIDGVPNELGTFGGDWSVRNPTSGLVVASTDENGMLSVAGANIDTDPIIMGTPFTEWIGGASNIGAGTSLLPGRSSVGAADGTISNVTTEVGLIEHAVEVDKDRWYWIGFEASYQRAASTEARFRIRDGGTGAPTVSSPVVMFRPISDGEVGFSNHAQRFGIWRPSVSGTHRLLLTVQGSGGNVHINRDASDCALYCFDQGPRASVANAQLNRGGGSTAAPPQQTYVDLAPNGWVSYRGDGTPRGDVDGPVQGWDPSGFNGDQGGIWSFTLPSITGTIDRVDFYCYSTHWYYNSGGTAIFNLVRSGTGGNFDSVKMRPDWYVGGYPKPGGKAVTLPTDWWSYFHNNAGVDRVAGITVGNAGTTDLAYYGRFDGWGARLRIWYTQ